MSMYTLEELLKRWKQETLMVEQAIGQILQHLIAMQKQVKEIQQATGQLTKAAILIFSQQRECVARVTDDRMIPSSVTRATHSLVETRHTTAVG